MVARAYTVAFEGVEAREVEVQCAISPGLPSFSIVGLPNKAVSEAKDRVRAALVSLSLALPSKRITINLSPANLPKEGSHFDLPIALSLLAALEVIPSDVVAESIALGELSLDGSLVAVLGAMPAALLAAEQGRDLVCPKTCGAEAAWVEATRVIAAAGLGALINHFNGKSPIAPAEPGLVDDNNEIDDLRDIKGQERAKRALEIAAAGRHQLLLIGAPGEGKSMLAKRMPGILPPLTPQEALETSMIHSLAGLMREGGISRTRPFRQPLHTASEAALTGGGRGAKPGEICLAHNGVLFLDELPEILPNALQSLLQPLENDTVTVSRANAHVSYPCRFLLVAAANPCRCGHLADPARACARAPQCSQDYLGRISGALWDRFDLRVDVPPVTFDALDSEAVPVSSASVAKRVSDARRKQEERFADYPALRTNADLEGVLLDQFAAPDKDGKALLQQVSQKFKLSMRGYHRVLKVARTLADLDNEAHVLRHHIAEAVSFRMSSLKTA